MRRALRIIITAAAIVVGLIILGGGVFTLRVLARPALRPIPGTTHRQIGRQECIDCHAPIADEWRQSFHYRSLTGPYWKDVHDLGYSKIFDRTRKQCVNCHAPANVLDLTAGKSESGDGSESLGVECTPNLLREPRGTIPAARTDHPELGVDCTSCHVSQRGIAGSGRNATGAPHEVVADPRFHNASVTAGKLCRVCHRATVEAWSRTRLPSEGVTCLDCHMPSVNAPSVAGGTPRARRSHAFVADKDLSLLAKSLNSSLAITADRKARFRIVNDRVGHHFPSGGNWLFVKMQARDTTGRVVGETLAEYGRKEGLLLDVWPLTSDERIPFGERRDVLLPLPAGHGTVEAVVRYHDFMKVNPTIATLRAAY